MHVLLLTNLFPTTAAPYGGVFVANRVRALQATGHDVTCIPIRPKLRRVAGAVATRMGRQQAPLLDPGGLYAPMPLELSTISVTGVVVAHERGAQSEAARRITRWLAAQDARPHAIHAHGAYGFSAAGVARALSAMTGIPYVVTLHGSDVNHRMARHPKRVLRELRDARHLFFVSGALRRRAQELGLPEVPSSVIGNGFDPTIFHTALEPPGGARREELVAFVGRLELAKGADRIRPIMEAVLGKRPGVRFVAMGDGPLRSTLPADSREFRLLPPTTQEGVARLFRRARVVILPSRSEGWPTVIKEAQACGAAVVATDVGGIREAIGDPAWVVSNDATVVTNLADRVVQALDEWGNQDRWALPAAGHTWTDIVRVEMAVICQLLDGGEQCDDVPPADQGV